VAPKQDISSAIKARVNSLSPEKRAIFERRICQLGKSEWIEEHGAQKILEERDSISRSGACSKRDYVSTTSRRPMAFSLSFFSFDDGLSKNGKYDLIFKCAEFADRAGFAAIWTPERHFKPFGGLYPNPAILSAALAARTERIQLRGGSVVLPLHNTLRVAEEWAQVDNLSGGRVGIALGSGWHPDDFVLAPERFAARRDFLFSELDCLRILWAGGSVQLPNGIGEMTSVRIYPKPLQDRLPVWLTATSPETFVAAGQCGANILTGLIDQDIEACARKIKYYRESLLRNGFDPDSHCVTAMVHTYIGNDLEQTKELVRIPFYTYLRSFSQSSRGALGANATGLDGLTQEDETVLLSHLFEDYFKSRSLFGSLDQCQDTVNDLRAAGVDEIACLIDFGLDQSEILEGLPQLNALRMRNCI
jgi:natural product biosynthesis luciferase-like monooxygenase protein